MADLNDPCLACEIVARRVRPPGGVCLREGPFVVHGAAVRTPLRGWVVVTTVRHLRAWDDLDRAEQEALGPLVARVMRAQREALGAEHAYAVTLGEALRHFHLHVVPRYPDTPDRLRGARAFLAGEEDARPEPEVETAVAALAARLSRGVR